MAKRALKTLRIIMFLFIPKTHSRVRYPMYTGMQRSTYTNYRPPFGCLAKTCSSTHYQALVSRLFSKDPIP